MFKLLRFIFLLIIIAGATLIGVLYSVPAGERPQMITALTDYVEQHFGSTLAEVKQKIEQVVPLEMVSSLKIIEGGETFQQIASCGKTQTTALEKSTRSEIYRWTDENGELHFSDTRPGEIRHNEVMSVSYPNRKAYFKLKLIEDRASLPAFIRDKVSADVHQVYDILSRNLELEHLRKVFLTVRIIGTQADFQQYRSLMAPQLRTNSGFYTSQNNEAVVFQGDDPETMRAVIRHEATHVMMAGLYGVTPGWFNEGLAEYFAQLKLADQSRQVKPVDDHWQHLQRRLAAGTLSSLQGYLNLTPQQWYGGDLEDNYAVAWSLVYYLMSEPQGKIFLKNMMNEMAENYCWSGLGSDYFDAHYPGGIRAFEAGWQGWLGKATPNAHYY